MSSLMLVPLILSGPAMAVGTATVEALVGGRSAPGITTVGPAELRENDGASALVALRADGETAVRQGTWLGATGEVWAYARSTELTMLRLEPRAGWFEPLGEHWFIDTGARYAGEFLPGEPTLGSGRAEGSLSAGLQQETWRVSGVTSAVRRDYFWRQQWSFQAAEAGLAGQVHRDRLRLGAQVGAQVNSGVTIAPSGTLDRATGVQQRLRVDLGWTTRRVDLVLAWRLTLADEGQVENATRPQFSPIGQYADDADALSAGGFLQNRIDLGGTVRLSDLWTLQAAGLARLRSNAADQPTSTWSRTLHGEVGAERIVGETMSLVLTAGATEAALEDGTGVTDIYGWTGLRWGQ